VQCHHSDNATPNDMLGDARSGKQVGQHGPEA
jgi:hypothetical protein